MDLDLDLFRTGACLCGQVSEGLFVQCVFFVFSGLRRQCMAALVARVSIMGAGKMAALMLVFG